MNLTSYSCCVHNRPRSWGNFLVPCGNESKRVSMAMLGYAWINTTPPMTIFGPQEREKIYWIELQNPHASIHLEKFMYPLALVSCTPRKAYIFRFNTPTKNTCPASDIHTCLILRGYPSPPGPHTFLAKSKGLTPPWSPYL